MESFEQLAHQYQPMIHKIIYSLHIYKNIDEFYQIGLIALWDAQKNFTEEKGSFTSFAYLWIKGKILNQLTKDKRQEERTVWLEEEYWERIPGAPSPLQFEEEMMQIYSKVLTEKENKWLTHAISGLSVKEMAKSENVSVSTVKQWRAGARKKLRKRLKTLP